MEVTGSDFPERKYKEGSITWGSLSSWSLAPCSSGLCDGFWATRHPGIKTFSSSVVSPGFLTHRTDLWSLFEMKWLYDLERHILLELGFFFLLLDECSHKEVQASVIVTSITLVHRHRNMPFSRYMIQGFTSDKTRLQVSRESLNFVVFSWVQTKIRFWIVCSNTEKHLVISALQISIHVYISVTRYS